MRKQNNCFCVAFVLLVLISNTVHAASWSKVTETEVSIFHVDQSSIGRNANGTIDIWEKMQLFNPDCAIGSTIIRGKCMTSSISYMRYFPNKETCIIQNTVYFTDGMSSTIDPKCSERLRVIPESAGEKIWEYLFQ